MNTTTPTILPTETWQQCKDLLDDPARLGVFGLCRYFRGLDNMLAASLTYILTTSRRAATDGRRCLYLGEKGVLSNDRIEMLHRVMLLTGEWGGVINSYTIGKVFPEEDYDFAVYVDIYMSRKNAKVQVGG